MSGLNRRTFFGAVAGVLAAIGLRKVPTLEADTFRLRPEAEHLGVDLAPEESVTVTEIFDRRYQYRYVFVRGGVKEGQAVYEEDLL